MVVAATAATGPAFASSSAARGGNPNLASSGFSPLRTQNRKTTEPTPIAIVMRFPLVAFAIRFCSNSNRLSPDAVMPRMCLSWLAAMIMPLAVMKPEITGCDRKLAMKPNRNTPIISRKAPDRKASVIAASMYWGVPVAAILPTAAVVISDTTATGPTASTRLVPNAA